MVNNAKIIKSTNSNNPNTSVIQMTNGNYPTGAVWGNFNNGNFFDTSHEQTASMWLYFGNNTNANGARPGDGMAFVLQNDKNGQNAIALSNTGVPVNGQALGVWGADWDYRNTSPNVVANTAIHNSWALEFDTFVDWETNNYKNEGVSFDYDIEDRSYQHIAGNYPASPNTYTWGYGTTNYFKMNHQSLKIRKLVDDEWHHVTIKWTPDPTNWQYGNLTYYYNDKDPNTGEKITGDVVTSNFKLDLTKFGFKETDQDRLLHWGFTGSTGKNSENNLIIFESIPSFVDADASSTVYDDTTNGAVVNEGGKVDPNDDIRYVFSLNYKGWTKDWNNIMANIAIPDHIKFDSGTVTYPNSQTDKNPHPIDSKVFTADPNATKLNFELPLPLTPDDRTAVIELKGKTEKTASTELTVPKKHASFEGDNLITGTDTPSFKINKKVLSLDSSSPNPITIPVKQDVTIPGQVTYIGNTTPNYSALHVHQIFKNVDTDLGKIVDSTGKFTFTIPQADLDDITSVSFYVTDNINTSNYITRQIIIGGNLSFGNVQDVVRFKPTNGSFENKILQRQNNWQVEVVDTRENPSSWIVQAKASKLYDNNVPLDGHIFFRDNQGKDYDLSQKPINVATKTKSGKQRQNISEQWTSNTGILMNMKKGNKAGSYNGVISWTLIDSTPNI